MKKFLLFALAALMLCLPVMAHPDGGSLGDVPDTTENIAVDGIKDEIYSYGLKVNVDQSLNGSPVAATGVAYLVYKDGTLYVYAEVTDKDVVLPSEADQQSQPWVIDSFEVFINPANDDSSDTLMQYRIDNEDWPSVVAPGGITAYGADAASEYFSFAEADSDTGYCVEFAIPVTETTVGINFQINDISSDGTDQTWAMPYSEVTGEGPGSWVPAEYPFITIGNTTAALPAAEPETVEAETAAAETAPADETAGGSDTTNVPAAQTADMFAVAAFAAVIALAGAVVIKKH